ncbi:MAG: uracil-DNA glycosylase family protein [Gammaproteobacteria bacterium]
MKMNIAEQEKKLFAEWEADKTLFVRDGVLDEKEYAKHFPKVAFVLKEYAHPQPKERGFDLRNEEFSTASYQLWRKIGKVMHGIRQMHLPPEQREEYAGGMHPSACAFNLDKDGGNRETDMVRLALRAMRDAHFIRRQFEIYNPDVTICAGTYEIFKFVLGHEGHEWDKSADVWHYQRAPGKYVLATYHPSYPPETAENFIEAVRALKLPTR